MNGPSQPLTRRRFLRDSGRALGLTGLAALAACGGGATVVTQPAAGSAPATAIAPTTATSITLPSSTNAAPPSSTPVAAPSATPGPIPTATVGLASAPVGSPPRATAVAPAAGSGATFNGIAAERTPEGFFGLGDPAARVVLTDYSDFL